MQTFDQSIFNLYSQGKVTLEESLKWASNVDEFKLKVQGVSTTADMSRDQMATSVFGNSTAPSPVKKPLGAGGRPEITRFGK
jgi:twitching motility protein PilT